MKATVKDLILGNAAITARIQAVLPDVSNDTNAAFVAVVLGDDPLLNLIGRVASDLDFADQQITDLAVRIGQRMGDTKSSVERGEHLPSNGVLQQTAHDLDRLCSERSALINHLKMLMHVWSKQRVPVGQYEPGACETCGRRDGQHDNEDCLK